MAWRPLRPAVPRPTPARPPRKPAISQTLLDSATDRGALLLLAATLVAGLVVCGLRSNSAVLRTLPKPVAGEWCPGRSQRMTPGPAGPHERNIQSEIMPSGHRSLSENHCDSCAQRATVREYGASQGARQFCKSNCMERMEGSEPTMDTGNGSTQCKETSQPHNTGKRHHHLQMLEHPPDPPPHRTQGAMPDMRISQPAAWRRHRLASLNQTRQILTAQHMP